MRQQRTTTVPAATATNIVGMLQQAGGGAGYHLSDFPLCAAAACPPPAQRWRNRQISGRKNDKLKLLSRKWSEFLSLSLTLRERWGGACPRAPFLRRLLLCSFHRRPQV